MTDGSGSDQVFFSVPFIDNLPVLVIGFDEDLELVCWNEKAREVTGYSFEEATKSGLPLFFHKYLRKEQPLDEEISCEPVSFRDKNGAIRNVRFHYQVVPPSGTSRKLYLFSGADLTEEYDLRLELRKKEHHLKQVTTRLKKFITLDAHTGVLNYRHLMSRLKEAFYASLEGERPLTLLIINLDYFHSINSSYGMAGGDRILREVAQIIKADLEESAFAGRFTGTEFAVVFPGVDVNTAFKRAVRLYSLITDREFRFDGKNGAVSLSVHMALGGVPHCEDVSTSEQLISRVADKLKEGRKTGISSPIFMCASNSQTRRGLRKGRVRPLDREDYRYTIEFVNALANTLKTKDRYIKEHSRLMSNYAVSMAEYLGMDEKSIRSVRYGAVLHDIGKLGIDKMILLKKGTLTAREYEIIKEHPRIGAEIIRNVHPLKEVVPLILYHHERFDGNGYLEGLSGQEIPLGARIISLADVFQALTSDRPYRRALKDEDAFRIIEDYSGSYFDPQVVDAFFEVYHPAE